MKLLTEDDIIERAERRQHMLRFYLGKAFRLPLIGRFYAGVSMPVRKVLRCDNCGTWNREAGVVIGVLLGWWLLKVLVQHL